MPRALLNYLYLGLLKLRRDEENLEELRSVRESGCNSNHPSVPSVGFGGTAYFR